MIMRKTFLLKTMLLLCALVAGSSSVCADDVTVTWTISGVVTTQNTSGGCQVNTALRTSSISPSGASGTWTAVSNNDKSYAATDNGAAHLGAGSNREFNGTITLSSTSIPSEAKIKSVTVTAISNGSSTLSATVGGNSLGSNKTISGTTSKDYTISGSSQTGNSVVLTLSGTATSKYVTISKIAITYTPPVEVKVATPTFSLADGLYYGTKSVTISTSTEGDNIYYTTDGSNPTSSSNLYSSAISVSSSQTIKAIGIKDGIEDSDIASAEYTIITSIPARTPKSYNSNYFVKVTDVDELENGDAILIVNQEGTKAMAGQNDNHYRNEVTVSSSDGIITSVPNDAQKIVLIKTGNRFFFSTGDNSYIYASTSSNYNYIDTGNEETAGANAMVSVEIAANGNASIIFMGDKTKNNLRYNSSSPRFTCYASTSTMPVAQIYKELPVITLNSACNDGNGIIYGTYYTNRAYFMPATLKGSVVSVDGSGNLSIDEVYDGSKGEIVPANVALLISTSDVFSGTKDYGIVYTTGGDDYSNYNDLKGTLTADENTTGDGCLFYRLTMHNGTDLGFWWGNTAGAAFKPGANKAYLAVPTSAAREGFAFGEETNGITTNNREAMANDRYYNLQGVEVAQPSRGLYIVNGKKVVIK